MCKSRKEGEVRYISNQNSDFSESGDDEFVFGIEAKQGSPFIEVKIEGRPCKLLIDSGATVNCIDRQTFESLRPSIPLEKSEQRSIHMPQNCH